MRTFVVKDPLFSVAYQTPSGSEIVFDAEKSVTVEGDDLEYLRRFIPFQNLLQSGKVVEVDGAIPPESLNDLSFETIARSISNCSDIDYLEAYLQTATAPLVSETIVRRLLELQERISQLVGTTPNVSWESFNPEQSSAAELKEAIAACNDPKTLSAWLPKVSRRVQGVINARISELTSIEGVA